jgi:hypothetical protein
MSGIRNGKGGRTRFAPYWRRLLAGFRGSIALHWPVFLGLLIFPFLSAEVLCLVECSKNPGMHTYWDAVYATWIAMTTVGYGDMAPVTGLGRLIASLDAFVGLILVGSVVWLFTRSLGGMQDDSNGSDDGDSN